MDHSLPYFTVLKPSNDPLQEAYAWMKCLMVATSGVMEQISLGDIVFIFLMMYIKVGIV